MKCNGGYLSFFFIECGFWYIFCGVLFIWYVKNFFEEICVGVFWEYVIVFFVDVCENFGFDGRRVFVDKEIFMFWEYYELDIEFEGRSWFWSVV